jgi:hypothetical protein
VTEQQDCKWCGHAQGEHMWFDPHPCGVGSGCKCAGFDDADRELGPVAVIGPECFASADRSVICWQGVNYYRGTTRAPLVLDKPRVQWEDDERNRHRWWQR